LNNITLLFKTPDVISDALEGVSEEEKEKVMEVCRKFVKYGEYLKVEIDIEKQTARVVT
jgi:hypothetical protein